MPVILDLLLERQRAEAALPMRIPAAAHSPPIKSAPVALSPSDASLVSGSLTGTNPLDLVFADRGGEEDDEIDRDMCAKCFDMLNHAHEARCHQCSDRFCASCARRAEMLRCSRCKSDTCPACAAFHPFSRCSWCEDQFCAECTSAVQVKVCAECHVGTCGDCVDVMPAYSCAMCEREVCARCMANETQCKQCCGITADAASDFDDDA